MKKFEFSLEKISLYKKQLLDGEKNTLMDLRRKRADIEEQINSIKLQILDSNNRLNQMFIQGSDIYSIKMENFSIDSGRYRIKELEVNLRDLDVDIDMQLKLVLSLSKDVSGLDKLYEKQFEEYNFKVMKKEESDIAEYISSGIAREMRRDN